MPLDLLLVHPVFLSLNRTERELMSPYFPLGLLYLAAFLRERGVSVDIFDGTFLDGPNDFAEVLKERQPRFVGISVLQPNRAMALALARIAKQHNTVVIFGGPDPTMSPETYLAQPEIDLIVHHEGELTLAELMEALLGLTPQPPSLYMIPGIAFRDAAGSVVVNPRRDYILDLDQLPLPARDLIDLDQYIHMWKETNGYASLSISVSRGCPYGCKHCQDAVHGPAFRKRSPQSVAAEVKELMRRYNIDRLRLVDDVDGIELEWLQAWSDAATASGAVLPFEALYELKRKEIPMLDVRDSL